MTTKPILTREYHTEELEKIRQTAIKEADHRREYDDDRALSNWAEGATKSYHLNALKVIEAGFQAEHYMLVEGDRVVNATIKESSYGYGNYYWLLHSDEKDLIERRGKRFIPMKTGKTSRVQKKLGLEEKMVSIPVKDFFVCECKFLGDTMRYNTVAA